VGVDLSFALNVGGKLLVAQSGTTRGILGLETPVLACEIGMKCPQPMTSHDTMCRKPIGTSTTEYLPCTANRAQWGHYKQSLGVGVEVRYSLQFPARYSLTTALVGKTRCWCNTGLAAGCGLVDLHSSSSEWASDLHLVHCNR
jgi:hypothetical protein